MKLLSSSPRKNSDITKSVDVVVVLVWLCCRAIQKQNCFHKYGSDAPCLVSTTVYIGLYGVVQIFLSQIPNFGELWWLSYVAAIMSFTYSFIGLGLGISRSTSEKIELYLSFLLLVVGVFVNAARACVKVFSEL